MRRDGRLSYCVLIACFFSAWLQKRTVAVQAVRCRAVVAESVNEHWAIRTTVRAVDRRLYTGTRCPLPAGRSDASV